MNIPFNAEKQFGFIKSDEPHKNLYFHIQHVKKKLWPRLRVKKRVSYVERYVKGYPVSAQGLCFLENDQETAAVKNVSKTTSLKKEQTDQKTALLVEKKKQHKKLSFQVDSHIEDD